MTDWVTICIGLIAFHTIWDAIDIYKIKKRLKEIEKIQEGDID